MWSYVFISSLLNLQKSLIQCSQILVRIRITGWLIKSDYCVCSSPHPQFLI